MEIVKANTAKPVRCSPGPYQHVFANFAGDLRCRLRSILPNSRRQCIQPRPEGYQLCQAKCHQEKYDYAKADEIICFRRDCLKDLDKRASVVLTSALGNINPISVQPLSPSSVQRLDACDVCDGPMNDVVDTPHDSRRKRENDKKRQKNGEAKRDRLRKPGFECLLKRPDKRHAEKCKRHRLEYDSSKVKCGGYKERYEENSDGATGFNAVPGGFLVAHFRSPVAFEDNALLISRPDIERREPEWNFSASCSIGCGPVIVRAMNFHEFGGSSKQQPKAEHKDDDLNQCCENQPHKAQDIAGGHPARRPATRRLDDRNASLRCAEEVKQQLGHFKHHHQTREHDTERARRNADPSSALKGQNRWTEI